MVIILLITIFLISGCEVQETSKQRILESAKVTGVIDGDTIKIESPKNGKTLTVRLLHINTAEKGEKCYKEAKEKLQELVENKTIWLERDMQGTDKYNRSLRYVFLSHNTDPQNYENFVNLMIVKEGLATMLIIEPNMKYKLLFEKALKKAENSEGCLFKKSSFYGCFSIEEFHYNAEGDDCENANDEYVIIKNACEDIDMNGFTIKDSARHVYTFKKFILKSQESFTLHSGSGQDNKTDIYWNNKGACPIVWNNDGDSLFLRDSNEFLVLYYSY